MEGTRGEAPGCRRLHHRLNICINVSCRIDFSTLKDDHLFMTKSDSVDGLGLGGDGTVCLPVCGYPLGDIDGVPAQLSECFFELAPSFYSVGDHTENK